MVDDMYEAAQAMNEMKSEFSIIRTKVSTILYRLNRLEKIVSQQETFTDGVYYATYRGDSEAVGYVRDSKVYGNKPWEGSLTDAEMRENYTVVRVSDLPEV